jgi:hypothetical protein
VSAAPQTGVLSRDAEDVLARRELQSVLEAGARIVHVYDVDGEFVLHCTEGISATDLDAALNYGQRERALGERLGADRIAAGMRALLRAAPLEEPTR